MPRALLLIVALASAGLCESVIAQPQPEPVVPLHGFDNPLIGCNDGKESLDLRIAQCERAIEYGQALGVYYAALTSLGRVYREKAAYDDAVNTFSKILVDRPISAMSSMRIRGSMDPRTRRSLNRIAYYERGLTYAAAGKSDLAKADADSLLPFEKSKGAGLKDRCFIMAVAATDLDGALKDCDQAVAEKPDDAAFLEARGFAELKLKRFDAATKDFDAALGKEPKLATSLYLRGLAKKQSGDIKGSDSDIAAAKDIEADIARQFVVLGVAG